MTMSNKTDQKKLRLVLKSWGLKRTHCKQDTSFIMLPKADLFVDCRGVRERGLDKNNPKVYPGQIQEHSPLTLTSMVALIQDSLRHVADRRIGKQDPYAEPYVICFFCAWGINRSPTTKRVVAKRLTALGYDVTVEQETFSDLIDLCGE